MESNKGFFLFVAQVSLPVSNAKIFRDLEAKKPHFPAQDLLVATDFEKTFSSNALEPVMYISEARWVVRWVKVYHTIPIPVKGAQMACTRLLSVYIHIYIYYMIIYVCIYIFVLSYYRKIIKSKWSINDLLGSTVVVLRLLLVVTFYYDIHAYMCVFMISCYSTIESVLRCCCSCNIIYVHMRSTTTIILICQCHLVPWTLLILWRPEI